MSTPVAEARTDDPPVVDDSACGGAQASICVTFARGPGQDAIAPVTISPGRSCAVQDVTDARYRTRDADGHVRTYEPDELDGSSVREVISDCAPAGVLADTTFVTVSLPAKRSDYLSVLDVSKSGLSGGSYENGLLPAVYFDGSNAGYIRPLRGDDDVNYRDAFIDNQFVHVVVHTAGHVLHPTIANAGPSRPASGTPVTLTADVPDAPAGLTYRWTFRDGSTATTTKPSVSHTYATAAGSYQPFVTVTATDTSYGQSDPLSPAIVFGNPPRSSGSPGVGGRGKSTAPKDGPVNGRGNRAGGAPTAASGSGGDGARPGGASGSGTATRSTPAGSTTATRPPGGVDGAVAVDGLLLDPVAGGPAAQPGRDAPAAAPSAREAGDDPLDLGLLWLLVPLALLGVGVATERRRPARPAGKAQHQ